MKFPHFKDLILFEDDHVIVINKPAFISTLDDRSGDTITIIRMAKQYLPDAQVCHRLDRETSGALVIAKDAETYRAISMQFEHREVSKIYHAFVDGHHKFDDLLIDLPIVNYGKSNVKIDKIVPPIQSQSNCWFNAFFITFFVSDKGRKFFHFFRQLMIEGIQANGELIPQKLRNGFALLNYAIEACLTGNKYAYILDTNAIIRNIYDAVPESYKDKLPYITNVDEAGNPMRYYGSIIHYLHNKSLEFNGLVFLYSRLFGSFIFVSGL